MPTYIKKPVPVQATKFIERDFEHWEPWVQNTYNKKEWRYRFDPETGLANGFWIKDDNEGYFLGEPGDYLVKDPDGDLHVYDGKFFEEIYEKIEVKENGRVE